MNTETTNITSGNGHVSPSYQEELLRLQSCNIFERARYEVDIVFVPWHIIREYS